MSRIGKKPIVLPSEVTVTILPGQVTVQGPKGNLSCRLHPHVHVTLQEKTLVLMVDRPEDAEDAALWGTFGSILANMVEGVCSGFEKKLEINGVGYKASVSGNTLTLEVGFSHPVQFSVPEGISVTVEKNVVTIRGIDKQLVGEVAARIRHVREPEPYKGKGIKYIDEVIRRKEGKSAKGAKAA